MKIAKVESKVLNEALKTKEFFGLDCYLCFFQRTPEGHFISDITEFDGKPTLSIRLSLEDYLFNEGQEAEKIWDIAERINGKRTIDLKVLAIAEL